MDYVTGFVVIFVVVLVATITIRRFATDRNATKAPPPRIPMARIGNLDSVVVAREAARRAASRVASRTGQAITFAFLFAVIVVPIVLVLLVSSALSSTDVLGTKGRVLRIKNRAQLPELATGDGWSADGVLLDKQLTREQRECIGELWLLTARMEHASVAAFSQLSLHLSALGAPARLVAATHAAALEEIEHAKQTFAIARAITGVAHTAGPIVALDRGAGSAIDLTRLAIGSLVDGCLGEGIASDVAGNSAERADERAIRATLKTIAREEAGHAELAWDVLAWCLEQGDAAVHRAVAARVEALGQELAPKLPEIRTIDEATLAQYGVIDQSSLGAIASARIAAVQKRARELLGQRGRLAA